MLRKVETPARHLDDSISEAVSPGELFRVFRSLLRRQRWVILFSLAFAIGIAALYVVTTPPSFTATAKLIIDSKKVQLFNKDGGGPLGEDAPPDSQQVDSQVEILGSDNLARDVIGQFDLTKDPEFVGPGVGLIPEAAHFVTSMFDSSQGDSITEDELTERAVKGFAARLTVARARLTSVIEVSFSAGSPQRAADLANATIYAYISSQQQEKAEAAKRAGSWLQVRIQDLEDQARAAEQAVVEFKAKNNIVTVESNTVTGGKLLNEQRVAELNSQLSIAANDTADTKARLDRIQQIIDQGVPDATVADTLKSEVVSKLRSQYLELAAREADWSARYGANHLAAVNLRNQMREIRANIVAELQRLGETYKSDYEIAKQHEASIRAELGGAVSQSHTVSKAQIELAELQGKAQSYRALHDNFLQRYMEVMEQQTYPISEARMIVPATPPLRKSSPKTLLALAIAGAGGLLLGLGIGQVREFLDRVFRTRSQVEERLHTDCIAVVPALTKSPVVQATSSSDKKSKGGTSPGQLVCAKGPIWHVMESPFSRFTEAMRSIKMAIDLKEVGKQNKVIAFTSTLPNEGKSAIAASLGQLMSHAGTSTILVDCDLRNPSLTRLLAPNAELGFFDLIKGDAHLEDVIWVDESTGLEFLPQAMKTRSAHTGHALASEAAITLFEKLRERYEYILVDCAPMAPVVDVKATTLFVDSYVYVVEWGQTRYDVVERALKDANSIYERLVGIVLNKVDMTALARYDGYGAKYHFNKHYTRYGYTD